MLTTLINGQDIQVDAEGFLTSYDEWNEDIAASLAQAIGVELAEEHWEVLRFLRADFLEKGETATARRGPARSHRARGCAVGRRHGRVWGLGTAGHQRRGRGRLQGVREWQAWCVRWLCVL